MDQVKTHAPKILIIGGGLTGSVTASLIKHEGLADIEIWERENHIGGRFYTLYDSSDVPCSVDFGAQYISASIEFIRSHARFYDDLLDNDKLVPLGQKIENFRRLSESITNFVAPQGTSSLIQHFLDQAGAKVCLEHEVEEMNLVDKVWKVIAKNGTVKSFDAVILTIPVPEVLNLKGNFNNFIPDDDTKMAMEQVKFSSRYAVALIYDESPKAIEELPWSIKFIPDDDTICFIAVDNRKRGRQEEKPALLLHTTTKFPQKCSEWSEEEIKKAVLEQFKCLVPGLPDPSEVKCIKWNFSQVIDAYIDNPGCIVLSEHPCLICGGDSFTESNFNGCLTSALRIVEELLKHVTIAKNSKIHKKRAVPVAAQ